VRGFIGLGVMFVALASPAFAARTDRIVLTNGDRITGRVESMTRGSLSLTTDDAGRMAIQWGKVAEVTSVRDFQCTLGTGEKYFGPLSPGPEQGTLTIGVDEGAKVLQLAEVVDVTPMEEMFYSRLRAYLDLGFTYAKAKSALTFSGAGEITYRGQHLGGGLKANTYLQNDSESARLASRVSSTLTGTYYFERPLLQLQFGVDQNDELDLLLRLSLGAYVAYPLVRNNWTEVWLSSGLQAEREVYRDQTPNFNLAALVAADWQAFRLDHPRLDVGVRVEVVPLLTDLGRVRGTTSLRAKYELFTDFNIGLNFSFTFDTRPPSTSTATTATTQNTDYILSATIGWSYGR